MIGYQSSQETAEPTVKSELAPDIFSRHAVVDLRTYDPSTVKKVLFWTKFFGSDDPRGAQGLGLFKGCPVSNCAGIADKALSGQSDAIMFHPVDFNSEDVPPTRDPSQRYIMYVGESPNNAKLHSAYAHFFNLTFTYRLDSDILGHYMYEVPLETKPRNFAEGKSRLVAWFASNCKTNSRREAYVYELRNHISVDIYGKCGKLQCSRDDESKCFDILKQKYKFYLSFENRYVELKN